MSAGFLINVDTHTLRLAAVVGAGAKDITALAAVNGLHQLRTQHPGADPADYVVDVTTDMDGSLILNGHTQRDAVVKGATRYTLPDLLTHAGNTYHQETP